VQIDGLVDDCIANNGALDMRHVQFRPQSTLLEDWIIIRLPRIPNLTRPAWEFRGAAAAASTPDLTPRALPHDLLSTNIDGGPRGFPVAQPALNASVLPPDALPSATAASMDLPRNIWPARRPGARAPVAGPAAQPTLAVPGSLPMHSLGKIYILEDDFQLDPRTEILEFSPVGWEVEEARLANIAHVLSIAFLVTRLVEGLVEWSRPLPSPESTFNRFQQEGIRLPCA
jgi:hypothetical protein